jgi:hypothetical protein
MTNLAPIFIALGPRATETAFNTLAILAILAAAALGIRSKASRYG